MRAVTLYTYINEMAYPTSFSMETFNNIPSYKGKIEYCNQQLQRISSGSSRVVYKIDDEKVLKLAKNSKGIAQNNVENAPYKQDYGVCAKVFEFDDDGRWLEMELAVKCKLSDFKRLLGIDFNVYCSFIDWTHSLYSRRAQYSKKYTQEQSDFFSDLVDNNEWLSNMHDMLCNETLDNIGDLKRINSYGIVQRYGGDYLVLVDFGLDDDVFNTHYSK